jgi:hypothetical protein
MAKNVAVPLGSRNKIIMEVDKREIFHRQHIITTKGKIEQESEFFWFLDNFVFSHHQSCHLHPF